jgi:hypothetical protein
VDKIKQKKYNHQTEIEYSCKNRAVGLVLRSEWQWQLTKSGGFGSQKGKKGVTSGNGTPFASIKAKPKTNIKK